MPKCLLAFDLFPNKLVQPMTATQPNHSILSQWKHWRSNTSFLVLSFNVSLIFPHLWKKTGWGERKQVRRERLQRVSRGCGFHQQLHSKCIHEQSPIEKRILDVPPMCLSLSILFPKNDVITSNAWNTHILVPDVYGMVIGPWTFNKLQTLPWWASICVESPAVVSDDKKESKERKQRKLNLFVQNEDRSI